MALSSLVRRTVVITGLALSSVLVLLPLSPAAATPPSTVAVAGTVAQDELSFLQKLNQERVRAGLAPLVSDSKLAPTSRSWSQTMANANRLYHDPNLAAVATQVEPSWRSVGENVGIGYSVQSLHDAFMASSGHRANILKSGFNRVGIGVVHAGTKIWVTVRFLQGPAISGTTGLAPAPPPGWRTVLTGDFDGDGYEDMLTYNPGTTADELWFGRADRRMVKVSVSVSGQYRPVAGDFDRDGRTEILWYAPGTTSDTRWEWNGSGWTSRSLSVGGTFRPLVGDFDGDGADDVLWYAAGSAADYYWYGNSDGSFTGTTTSIVGTYVPIIGDLDGDGGADILWYAKGTAKDYFWYSTGQRGSYTSVLTSIVGSYTPFAGDFDANGSDDLFWYAPGSAKDYVWYTTATHGRYTSVLRSVIGSYVPGAGDFDGNGAADVVWFSPNSATGDTIWFGTVGAPSYSSSSVRS